MHGVTVINYLGDILKMELRNPEKSGFLIFNITGLGPEKAEIQMTNIITADGGIYNSARLPARNIVLSIRFFSWKNKDIEEIRQESYKYFPIKKYLTLIFEMNNRVCEIEGYVESNEPVIFSRETHTQLSIICPYPYFRSSGPDNITIFYGVEPMFEFPFSNEDLVKPLLIMGEIRNRTEEVVTYDGDSEVGITIIIDAIGDVRNVIIHNVLTRETMRINTDRLVKMTGSAIIAGDRIIISTITGRKSITLLRKGIYTNILNALDRGADWFQLAKGDNIFAFEAEYGTVNLQFRIENQTLYEGV